MKIILFLVVVAMAYTSGIGSAIASAQQANALPVEDTLQIRSFPQWTLFQFSPNGKWLAYVVEDERNDRDLNLRDRITSRLGGTDIWLLNIETGEARNLTSDSGKSRLPSWSPNGHFLAFISDRDGSGQEHVWVWDTMKNDLRKVSDIQLKEWRPMEWTADSRSILISTMPEAPPANASAKRSQPKLEDRDGALGESGRPTLQLYQSSGTKQRENWESDPWDLDIHLCGLAMVDVVTGKTTVVVHTQKIMTHRLSPDGSRVAYTVPRRFEKPGQEILYDLVVIRLATMEEHVVAKNIRLWSEGDFSWSPDGKLLSYRIGSTIIGATLSRSADGTLLRPQSSGTDEDLMNDCYIVSVTGGSPRNITHLSTIQASVAYTSKMAWWDKAGSHIYFIVNGNLWQAAVNQDRATELARIPYHRMSWQSLPQSTTLLETIDGGTSVVVAAKNDDQTQEGLFKISLTTGGTTKLFEAGQCYTCGWFWDAYAVAPGGRYVAYIAEDAQHAFDLWLSDTAFKAPRRLTHLNPQIEKYGLGSARVIDWLSDDGERLHGALLLPSAYELGKRYPLIVGVAGGEWLSQAFSKFGFTRLTTNWAVDMNMQLLATRGYVVLLPDSPQHEGTPMTDLAKTVLPGVNKVIDMGIADPDRLGVMGLSSRSAVGSALVLLAQTQRFKAGIEMGGTADLYGLYLHKDDMSKSYATSEMHGIEYDIGGTPWQFRDRYIENSPVFYLDRVVTPLLIVQTAHAGSIPALLSDQSFVALQRLGKEVEYAKYEDDSSSFKRYFNQLDFCNRVIDWFDKYLKQTVPATVAGEY